MKTITMFIMMFAAFAGYCEDAKEMKVENLTLSRTSVYCEIDVEYLKSKKIWLYDGRAYRLVKSTTTTRAQQEAECRKMGGWLAKIGSLVDNAFIRSRILEIGGYINVDMREYCQLWLHDKKHETTAQRNDINRPFVVWNAYWGLETDHNGIDNRWTGGMFDYKGVVKTSKPDLETGLPVLPAMFGHGEIKQYGYICEWDNLELAKKAFPDCEVVKVNIKLKNIREKDFGPWGRINDVTENEARAAKFKAMMAATAPKYRENEASLKKRMEKVASQLDAEEAADSAAAQKEQKEKWDAKINEVNEKSRQRSIESRSAAAAKREAETKEPIRSSGPDYMKYHKDEPVRDNRPDFTKNNKDVSDETN